jgi:hypothetical protein
MTPERWQRIEEIFAAASLLPSAERDEYVRNICGDDTELSREILIRKLVHEHLETAARRQGVSDGGRV